jgi:Protein of unknown function (DUF3558)
VRYLLVPVVAALALALAGCSQETPGDATAGGSTGKLTLPGGTEEPTETPTETSTSEGGGSGTAGLEPCDLLSSAEQAQFQLGPGAEDEVGPARTCQWQSSGQTVTIGVIDTLGLDQVQSSGPKTPMKVGSHDAVQYTGGVASCAVAIAVTDTSRVDVAGAAGGDETKACSVAKQAAALVEPKLP